MPKRLTTKRFESTSVQGEDSFVVMRRPKWKELRPYMKRDEDSDMARVEIGEAVLPNLIVAWNWVDDDDKPYPLPKGDPEIIGDLADAEVNWLMDCLNSLMPSEEERKNSPSAS